MSISKITSSSSSFKKITSKRSKKRGIPFMLKIIRLGFKHLGPILPQLAGNIAFKLFASPKKIKSSRKPSAIMDEARTFNIVHQDRKIQCYAWGKQGPKVLLVHGWESKAAHMQNFVPPLVEMGYEVLAFDGPAHGKSEGKQTNLIDFSHTIETLALKVGGITHIIAHSFGSGASGVALSESTSQLFVNKLVMITSPNKLQDIFNDFYRIVRMPAIVQNHFEILIERIVNKPIEHFEMASRLKYARTNEIMLIHDENDTVIPIDFSKRIVALNPRIKFWATQGKGHYKIIKDREVIEQVVEFLES
ncbi:MAG: alpha/beta hydrolase [Bacteroidota bacterium]